MYHIKQTHNLEVPGSSPGWSTKGQALIAKNKAVNAYFLCLQEKSNDDLFPIKHCLKAAFSL